MSQAAPWHGFDRRYSIAHLGTSGMVACAGALSGLFLLLDARSPAAAWAADRPLSLNLVTVLRIQVRSSCPDPVRAMEPTCRVPSRGPDVMAVGGHPPWPFPPACLLAPAGLHRIDGSRPVLCLVLVGGRHQRRASSGGEGGGQREHRDLLLLLLLLLVLPLDSATLPTRVGPKARACCDHQA